MPSLAASVFESWGGSLTVAAGAVIAAMSMVRTPSSRGESAPVWCIYAADATRNPRFGGARGSLPGSPVRDALENFDMTREGPNTAFYRDQDGERVEMKNVHRIQFYDNVVIIRLRDGTGRLVPVAEFLGVAW